MRSVQGQIEVWKGDVAGGLSCTPESLEVASDDIRIAIALHLSRDMMPLESRRPAWMKPGDDRADARDEFDSGRARDCAATVRDLKG